MKSNMCRRPKTLSYGKFRLVALALITPAQHNDTSLDSNLTA
jgi:hypothetical protein